MLFHVGVLWRLNEAGILSRLDGVSSVSGGSIVAGLLATRWSDLGFDDAGVATHFHAEVVYPLRGLAAMTIDIPAIGVGLATPRTISDGIVRSYGRLYGDATLQDFPDVPVFFIHATNLQTGIGWTFSKRDMGDYIVGRIRDPELDVAVAVAASSAFPPFLAPVRLDLRDQSFHGGQDDPYFQDHVLLIDGGVEDNLGLRPIHRFETVLVSDGGGRSRPIGNPSTDWLSLTARVMGLIHDQPSELRTRQIITAFVGGMHRGVFFILGRDIRDYGPTSVELRQRLAGIPTRLSRLDERTQQDLINWGYIVADGNLRRYFDPSIPRSDSIPYPNAPDSR